MLYVVSSTSFLEVKIFPVDTLYWYLCAVCDCVIISVKLLTEFGWLRCN